MVYNITAYLSFHPGSVSELMKGAGIDCTVLFDNVSDDPLNRHLLSIVELLVYKINRLICKC